MSVHSPGNQPTNQRGQALWRQRCDVSTVTPMAEAGGQRWPAEAPSCPVGARGGGTAAESEPGEPPLSSRPAFPAGIPWARRCPSACPPWDLQGHRPPSSRDPLSRRLRGEVGTCLRIGRASRGVGKCQAGGGWGIATYSLLLEPVMNIAFRGGFPVGK